MLTQKQVADALASTPSVAAAARQLGVPGSTLRDAIKRLDKDPVHSIPPQGMQVKKHSVTLDAEGGVKSTSIQSVARNGDKFEIQPGQVVKGESALLAPDGSVIAKWVKTREESQADHLQTALLAAFAEHTGLSPEIPPPLSSDINTLTVYPLPDLHFGMHAWRSETGSNYDIKIAQGLAIASVAQLVAQSRPSKRAVLLGLGDYFHQNDQKNATPRSGHRLDVDGRWAKVYQAGAELCLQLINLLLDKHEVVEVVMLPGNHDEDAAITLRVALGLFYGNNPRVQVYSNAGLSWYSRFGLTLLGAHHGHTMKADRMAMMLATDRAKDWGETIFRHFFFGHIHHETAKEVGPVRVESFQTPAARDAYAQDGGYRSGRSMTAITFHAEFGEIGRHRVNITRS